MNIDSHNRESVTGTKRAGWKWLPKRGYLWIPMMILAALTLLLTAAAFVWSMQDIDKHCRSEHPTDVAQCVDEAEEGMVVFVGLGVVVSVALAYASGVGRRGPAIPYGTPSPPPPGDRESVTESKGAGWKWIAQQGVHLWWDGERYTWRADWDGAEWHVEPVAKRTHREPPPAQAAAQATAEAKPPIPATRAVRIWMKVLIVAFWATFVWFVMETESKQCFPEGPATQTYTDVSDAVGPWMVLVGLSFVGVCTWQWFAEKVAWVKQAAIVGMVVTAVTCPILVDCAGAMNCGL